MKHISILVPKEAVPAAIVDPRYMFTAINQFYDQAGKDPVFTVELVGLTRQVSLINSVFSVNTDRLLKDVKKTDLIIVPALSGDVRKAVEMNCHRDRAGFHVFLIRVADLSEEFFQIHF